MTEYVGRLPKAGANEELEVLGVEKDADFQQVGKLRALIARGTSYCLDYIRYYSHKCIGVRRNARNQVFQPLLFRKTYRWGADKYSAAGGRSAQC